MVELKSRICVKSLCACRGPYVPHQRLQSTPSTIVNPTSVIAPTAVSPSALTSSTTVTPAVAPTASPTVPHLQRHRRGHSHLLLGEEHHHQHHHHLQQLRRQRPSSASLHPLRRRFLSPQSKMMSSGPHASRIVRKYRRSRLKRVKRQEYQKLREMVPALHEKPKVSKVEVIEEAIKYIDELHSALIQRFRARGLPSILKDVPVEAREVHGGNIRELVRHLLATSNPASLPPARIENARTLPSFIQKIGKARRL